MKRFIPLGVYALLSLATTRLAFEQRILLHEWMTLTMAGPVIYAGIRFGWTTSTFVMFILLIANSPIAVMKYAETPQLGIDFELSTVAVGTISVYLGRVIKRDAENGESLDKIHRILDDIRKNADINKLLASLIRIFRERMKIDIVELFLFDEGGDLRSFEKPEEGPLRRDHLYYRVAADGKYFVSDSIQNDARIAPLDPAQGETGASQIAVFPIEAGGRPVGVISVVGDSPVRISRDAISFMQSAKSATEFAIEAIEKRMETIGLEIRREEIKNTFSSYVSRAVAEEILNNPDAHGAGGKLAEVTVMFAEISNFKELLKTSDAEELVEMLNEFFSMAVRSVLAHDGTVDKFIGGKVMAYWGAPIPVLGGGEKSIAAARKILRDAELLNEKWARRGKAAFKARVGINSGEVIAGNIGGVRRMEYTVIGDTVNAAARIASLALEMETPLLIGESTAREAAGSIGSARKIVSVVKGKNEEITVFQLD